MFEGVKVSRQLLLFGWDFRGVQEQGPMLSALKGGANTSSKGGGGKHWNPQKLCVYLKWVLESLGCLHVINTHSAQILLLSRSHNRCLRKDFFFHPVSIFSTCMESFFFFIRNILPWVDLSPWDMICRLSLKQLRLLSHPLKIRPCLVKPGCAEVLNTSGWHMLVSHDALCIQISAVCGKYTQ